MESLPNCQTSAERMLRYQPPSWEALPDLGLYMDQVITFLERQLSPLCLTSINDKIITPAMINNYVKMQLIPRPVGKKYEQSHLAALLILCTLKQVLPMEAIGRLLPNPGEDIRNMYEKFCELQHTAFQHASNALAAAETDALYCAVQASAFCLAAEILLPSACESEKS